MKKFALILAVFLVPFTVFAAPGAGEEEKKETASETVTVAPETKTLFARVKRQYKKWQGYLVGMKAVSPIEAAELGRIDEDKELAESVSDSEKVKQ